MKNADCPTTGAPKGSSGVVPEKEEGSARIVVRINGEQREVPAGLDIASLLRHLDVRSAKVAIERNREVVSKASYDSTPVEDGDLIEIVSFIGGG
ncbi:MAG: sulfur carrier protein ThiS [Myxococcota bacterium]